MSISRRPLGKVSSHRLNREYLLSERKQVALVSKELRRAVCAEKKRLFLQEQETFATEELPPLKVRPTTTASRKGSTANSRQSTTENFWRKFGKKRVSAHKELARSYCEVLGPYSCGACMKQRLAGYYKKTHPFAFSEDVETVNPRTLVAPARLKDIYLMEVEISEEYDAAECPTENEVHLRVMKKGRTRKPEKPTRRQTPKAPERRVEKDREPSLFLPRIEVPVCDMKRQKSLIKRTKNSVNIPDAIMKHLLK